jgi:hypothetical protein
MKRKRTAKEHYLELTALLIDREITKFRRGEQAAPVSFDHVAKLVRNANEELAACGARGRLPADLRRCRSKRRGRTTSTAHGPATAF